MANGLYLGRQVDEKGKAGERVLLDPSDLLTHGLIVGMTGSGKTGLGVVLIEEVLKLGAGVIAIDPKGDLADLLLLFDDLAPASFEPWIDPERARRDGGPAMAAAEAADRARKGLAEWGLGPKDVAALRRARDAVILTPGSDAGVPLDVLQSLAAPGVPFDSAEEDLRDEIQSVVAGLLGLVRVDADPLQSPPAIFLATLVERAWRDGKGLSLETLIGQVAEPPFDKLGALPLETAFPRKDRQALMTSLNNLVASPSFESWRKGEPLDVERMLKAPDGRPRLAVVSIAHLSDDERMFVVALLLDKVKTWMRRQSGTSALRALVYMDEIFGFFPPSASPPTKRPMLTLLKQARAQGVGLVLATQNPVDLDYKGLANMGTWLVGTLQTQRDRERLASGLSGAGLEPAKAAALLDATRKRVFLLHDVHRPGPALLESRFAMSYLRGPLTREEIARLMDPVEAAQRAAAPATRARADATSPGGPPPLPAPWRSLFLAKYGGEIAEPHVLVKYAVRYKGTSETVGVRAWPLGGAGAADALEAEPFDVEEGAVATAAPSGVRYADLPPWLDVGGARAVDKAVRERLPDKLEVRLFRDPVTDESSRLGETREAFAARLSAEGGGDAAARLRDRLEKKQQDLAVREQEVAGRRQEKWLAIGTAVLKNIGLFTGRKRTVTGVSSVLTKNRMEGTAEARLDALRGEVADLQAQLAAATQADPARLEEQALVPARGAVKLLRCDFLWVY
jgi:hypothetical protein